jgi:hypothetical protein
MSNVMRWTDVFSEVSRSMVGNGGWKTSQAQQIVWEGIYERRLLCVVSTVRLLHGNMAHFCNNSGARIGENDWNPRGGHFLDLEVRSKDTLTDEELVRIAPRLRWAQCTSTDRVAAAAVLRSRLYFPRPERRHH